LRKTVCVPKWSVAAAQTLQGGFIAKA